MHRPRAGPDRHGEALARALPGQHRGAVARLPGPETAGFGLSIALRAHTKVTHELGFLWKAPRELNRPWWGRTGTALLRARSAVRSSFNIGELYKVGPVSSAWFTSSSVYSAARPAGDRAKDQPRRPASSACRGAWARVTVSRCKQASLVEKHC
jgi:hypothetical protein